jgi:hypothetical protein
MTIDDLIQRFGSQAVLEAEPHRDGPKWVGRIDGEKVPELDLRTEPVGGEVRLLLVMADSKIAISRWRATHEQPSSVSRTLGNIRQILAEDLEPGYHRGMHGTRKRVTSGPPDPRNQAVSASLRGSVWPRVESNHRTQLRRLPLCPLSYGAERGWRRGLEPPTTGTTTRGSTN